MRALRAVAQGDLVRLFEGPVTEELCNLARGQEDNAATQYWNTFDTRPVDLERKETQHLRRAGTLASIQEDQPSDSTP